MRIRKSGILSVAGLLVSSVYVFGSTALAAVMTERHDAGSTRTGHYQTSGFFAGGDRAVTSARLSDIRRGAFETGERIVFNLEPVSAETRGTPYFEFKSSPSEGRMVLSIWADVSYDFDKARVKKAFDKSKRIKRLNVMPRVEEGLTIVEFVMNDSGSHKPVRFEAFRLSNPSRIVVDLQ